MRRIIQFAVLIFLVSAPTFAEGNWTGYLIDAKCYESRIRNVNPWSTSTVDRNMDLDIKYCVPTVKTTSYGLVQADWTMLRFDSGGNSKAAEFVRSIGKQKSYFITVTGEINNKRLSPQSISLRQVTNARGIKETESPT